MPLLNDQDNSDLTKHSECFNYEKYIDAEKLTENHVRDPRTPQI